MAHISRTDLSIRSRISNHIQHLIDSADDSVSQDFIAGLETALAVVNGVADARPEDIRNV